MEFYFNLLLIMLKEILRLVLKLEGRAQKELL